MGRGLTVHLKALQAASGVRRCQLHLGSLSVNGEPSRTMVRISIGIDPSLAFKHEAFLRSLDGCKIRYSLF